ncbi:hypothetical protein ACCO45_012924 [Purpureocillium lilacinum]|uniref:Uncharacterized protein n=1 Tax=Purpureocillium lilacinum TaxID=33203 RepID=A0ACC4D9D8_PURLI
MQVVDPMRFPGRRAGAAAYPQGMVLPWTLQPSSAYTMDQAGVRPIGGEPLPPSLVSSRDALLPPLTSENIFNPPCDLTLSLPPIPPPPSPLVVRQSSYARDARQRPAQVHLDGGWPSERPSGYGTFKTGKREPRRAPAAQAPSLVSPVVSRVVRDVLLHFFRPRSLPGSCGLVLAPAARAARKLINKIIAQSACAPRANLSLLSFSPPSPASQPLYGPHKVKIPALTVPRLSRAAHDTCLRLPRAPAIRCPASAPGLCVGLPAVGAGSARHARGPSSLPPPRPVQLKGLSFSFWASALELSCAASRPADGNVVTMAIGSRGLGSANWHSRRLAIIRGLVPPDSDDFIVRLAKREKNWAAQNVGVMVVFCIVFVVAVGVISIFVHKALQRRKERKPTY